MVYWVDMVNHESIIRGHGRNGTLEDLVSRAGILSGESVKIVFWLEMVSKYSILDGYLVAVMFSMSTNMFKPT